MARIGVRELRQNASAYLKQVQEGEVIEVSVRGKLVARIVPVAESEWDKLVAEGNIRPPAPEARLHDIEALVADLDISASEVLRSLREHER